ncbi:hypothetical protein ACLB1G_21840 [Oxalobacteraceae bacterium A2-2]
MGIDKDQVYALIAKRPKIRTVEIADIIDCEPDQVEPALAQEIQRGDIVVHKVTAPNGRPANGFEFSGQFKQTEAYKAIGGMAGVESEPLVVSSAAVPPPPGAEVKEEVAVLMTNKREQTGLTHAETAIAFIRSAPGQLVNTNQLRKAMGLDQGRYPATYLMAALRDGRLARDGAMWTLGPAVDAGKEAVAPPLPIPLFRNATPPAIPAAAVSQQASGDPRRPAFRCARWSDGILELQRDGKTIAELTPDEQTILAASQASAV